mmetsp:Transcript_12008/g.22531  ORF Transcript_12008/g.22531 Transcript_12008/m.22531 type:complete len:389 (+) Transcript_12008:138-1304(+)
MDDDNNGMLENIMIISHEIPTPQQRIKCGIRTIVVILTIRHSTPAPRSSTTVVPHPPFLQQIHIQFLQLFRHRPYIRPRQSILIRHISYKPIQLQRIFPIPPIEFVAFLRSRLVRLPPISTDLLGISLLRPRWKGHLPQNLQLRTFHDFDPSHLFLLPPPHELHLERTAPVHHPEQHASQTPNVDLPVIQRRVLLVTQSPLEQFRRTIRHGGVSRGGVDDGQDVGSRGDRDGEGSGRSKVHEDGGRAEGGAAAGFDVDVVVAAVIIEGRSILRGPFVQQNIFQFDVSMRYVQVVHGREGVDDSSQEVEDFVRGEGSSSSSSSSQERKEYDVCWMLFPFLPHSLRGEITERNLLWEDRGRGGEYGHARGTFRTPPRRRRRRKQQCQPPK